MLCLLCYIYHLWMASILFDVIMYCRFSKFGKFKLVNSVISEPMVDNGLKNQKNFHVVRLFIGLV